MMNNIFIAGLLLVSACSQSMHYKRGLSKNPRVILRAADSAADAGDHHSAIAQYENVLSFSGLPQMLVKAVQFNLGLSLRASSQWERAEHAFAAALVPLTSADGYRASEAHRHLGEVNVALRDWSDAADHFAAALNAFALPPAEAKILLRSLGAARLNAGEPELALSAYEEAAAEIIVTGAVVRERSYHPAVSAVAAGADPSWIQMHAEWGVALALLGRLEEASQILNKLPESSCFVGLHSFVGMRLHEAAPMLAITHLERAVVAGDLEAAEVPASGDHTCEAAKSKAHPAVMRAVYDRLIRMYTKMAFPKDKRAALVAKALALGLWQQPDQRPGYIYPRKRLTARPWWSDDHRIGDLELLGSTSFLWRTARDLTDSFTALRRELIPGVPTPVSSASAEAPARLSGERDHALIFPDVKLTTDVEHVADHGNWSQLEFVQDGHWVLPINILARYPTTTALLEVFLAPGGASEALPKASMLLSFLAPGTHLRPHCGPTNHRLRLHLPLAVPRALPDQHGINSSGNSSLKLVDSKMNNTGPLLKHGGARLRVGSTTREWYEGEVAIFDDSFEHEAWNDDHSIVRSVLLVDVWHPELTEEDRESVRRDFAY